MFTNQHGDVEQTVWILIGAYHDAVYLVVACVAIEQQWYVQLLDSGCVSLASGGFAAAQHHNFVNSRDRIVIAFRFCSCYNGRIEQTV